MVRAREWVVRRGAAAVRALIAGGALFVVAATARAQGLLRAEGGEVWVRGDSGGVESPYRGPAAGGAGRIEIGPLLLGGEVIEGRLTPLSGPGVRRDLVEGAASVGLRFWPWLELSAGPRVRAYAPEAGT
jgi:hypothetical protein